MTGEIVRGICLARDLSKSIEINHRAVEWAESVPVRDDRTGGEAAGMFFSGLCFLTIAFLAVAMTVWDFIRPAVR